MTHNFGRSVYFRWDDSERGETRDLTLAELEASGSDAGKAG